MRSLALVLCVASFTAAAEPADGLLLYASFDGGPTPDYAAGARRADGQWTAVADGVLAGAFHNAGAGLHVPPACNFELGRGTAAWWVRLPARPALGPRDVRPLLISATNFQFMAEPRTNQWLFMTGTTPPDGNFTWSYSPSCGFDTIQPGAWTHIALTWDEPAGFKTISIDGVERARTATKLMRNMPSGAALVLGDGQPGDFDELLVWNRVLSPEEIARVKTDPAAIAAAARAIPAPQDMPWDIAPLPVERTALASLLAPGETFAVSIPFENRTDRAQRGDITVTLLDLWERPCSEPQNWTANIEPRGRYTLPVSVVAPRLGIFKLQVAINGRTRDVASFGCVPAGNPPAHPFFGAHVQGTPGTAEFGRRIGFSRSRVHDMQQFTWWQRMEPERGQWNEAVRDSYRGLSALGYAHWGEWFAAPHWAVTLPDGTHPPRHDGYPRPYVPSDADAVRSYVRKTLEWYPDIREWEVWNEPNVSGFWAGSPKDYAELAAVMYDEAKKVRPDITVFVQFGAGGPWYRDATKAGLLQHADGASFHAYATTKDHPQTWARMVGELKQALAAAGKPDLPLVDSEGGLTSNSFLRGIEHPKLPPESRRTYDFLTAAQLIVQWRVTMLAAGVRAHYYYFLGTESLGRDAGHRFSLTDATGGPLPAAIAQNALVWQLDGGAFASEVALPAGLRCYLFQRNAGDTLAVLWSEDGASANLAVPAEVTTGAYDVMGNPIVVTAEQPLAIGATPCYLRLAGKPDAAARLLAAAPLSARVEPAVPAGAVKGAPVPKAMDRFSLANEAGPQRLFPLDLAPAANMGLVDEKAGDSRGGWLDEGPYNDLSMLTQGRHEWLGVPFQIGADGGTGPCIVTLRGKTFPNGPQASAPLTVGRKIRALFFCHGANWSAKPGVTALTYELRYADGSTVALAAPYGQAVSNWWTDRADGEDARTVALLAKDPQEPKHPWRFLRVWQWENPRSDVAVESLRILAGAPEVTVAVVGITAATW